MLVQQFISRYIFNSIKEKNWLINKRICVRLFDVFNGCSWVKKLIVKGMSNIYYWEKLTFSKFVGKANFLGKKIEEIHYLWSAKTYKVYSRKRSFRYYCLQLSFVYKTVSQISFNLFCSGDKRLLSEFFRKWGWFQGHNERFPKYLS